MDVQKEARLQAARKRNNGMADGFLFWEEMGLGKTSTVLNEFMEERKKGTVNFLIVVTLNSFKQGWIDEAALVGTDMKIGMWPDCRNVPHTKLHGMVFNYESLIGSGGDHIASIIEQRKVYLAFDECHKIKNPGSAVTKRAMQLWKEVAIRRGCTGTPMSDNVVDLFPQLKLAGAIDGMNQYMFRNYYATMGGFKGKKVTGIKKDKLPELHRLLDRHSFRAFKTEWLDLPEQTFVAPFKVEMPPKLRAHYKEMQEEFVVMLGDEAITANMIISQMLKLQQISSGFIYDEMKTPHQLIDPMDMPKFGVVGDLVEALGGGSKLLIFAHFRPTVNLLIEYIEKKFGYTPALIRGGMDPKDIAKEKDMFNSDGPIDVMVAQTSVGSATHTLLGGPNKPCHTTLFFENNYNKIDRMQAESRNHRKGQRFAVSYYDIISSPAEAKPIKALQVKGDLIKAIIEGVRDGR